MKLFKKWSDISLMRKHTNKQNLRRGVIIIALSMYAYVRKEIRTGNVWNTEILALEVKFGIGTQLQIYFNLHEILVVERT